MAKGWKDLPIGGMIVEAGNSETYNTGAWRAFRPVRDVDECTNCLICWVNCPDSSIKTDDGNMVGFDLFHCKGCGICANVCPRNCIEMVEESQMAGVPEPPEEPGRAGGGK